MSETIQTYPFNTIPGVARLCHQANKAFCENLRDFSQPDWEKAEEWQRQSAVNGVRFLFNNPDASDSALHDKWMADKLADGWVFGEVKDGEKKTHPCLVAFDQLPPEQQAKDALFRAIVLAMKPFIVRLPME